jgi:hypothetical protein
VSNAETSRRSSAFKPGRVAYVARAMRGTGRKETSRALCLKPRHPLQGETPCI